MREIKFRGYWFKHYRLGSCMTETFSFDDYAGDQDGEMGNMDYPSEQDVKNGDAVIVQFTCLLDKNGKEIFEDDIVKGSWGYGETPCKVEIDSIIYAKIECTIPDDIEVLGNIYANPELLTS